ncbi:MAG: S8 family peptidase, partial [Muribaculaceae bacterium]|nr:S8 family peptidase [Muribaculaceae bacterium]
FREFTIEVVYAASQFDIQNMKRIILGAVALSIGYIGMSGQVTLRPADLNRLHILKSATPRMTEAVNPELTLTDAVNPDLLLTSADNRIEMLLRYDSAEALDEIRANGGEIVSEVTERAAIVSVSLDNATRIAASRGVRGAILPKLMKLANDQGRIFSKVNDVLAGTEIGKGYDGTGVVVGLFDVGLDPNHINFRDAEGNNRVKLWLQYSGSATTPKEYTTPEEIAKATTDSSSESHGTHVAGIMTGSFRETTNGLDKDYSGVAPGAEIVMAGGAGYNVQILDALQRIAIYAQEQGKPCVINLSFGDNMGSHDGTDPFTRSINEIAEKYDAVICLAAGNERNSAISIIKELTESRPYVQTLMNPGRYKPSGSTSNFQSHGDLEIWTEDDTPFDVTLDIIALDNPDKVLYSFNVPEGGPGYTAAGTMIKKHIPTNGATITYDDPLFTEYYKDSYMGGEKGVDELNNRYTAQLSVFLNALDKDVFSNIWTRVTVKGQPGKKIFMYCDEQYMKFGNRGVASIDTPNGAGSNSNMACGENTISVGSYVSNNIKGSGYTTSTIGDISYFSSWGETLDGRVMPDVCAPGQVIISSRNSHLSRTNSNYPIHASYTDPETNVKYNWTNCAGTSQASPHMAGICALWRQANPNLTFKDIQEIARATATAPEFDSKGWGYGKADALAGIKRILGLSSVYEIIENAPESILIENRGKDVFDIYAPGEERVSAAVFNLQGIEAEAHSVNGNSMSLDLSSLPAGIYVLKVTAPHSSRTIKISR